MFTEREEISRNVGRKKRMGNVDGGWWDISPEVKRGKPAAGKPCELLSANLLRSFRSSCGKVRKKKKSLYFRVACLCGGRALLIHTKYQYITINNINIEVAMLYIPF